MELQTASIKLNTFRWNIFKVKNRNYLVSKFPSITENLEAQIDCRELQDTQSFICNASPFDHNVVSALIRSNHSLLTRFLLTEL